MKTMHHGLAAALILVGALGVAGPHVVDAQDKKDKAKPATTAAAFEMYKDRSGGFRFRLKDADGNLLAISGKGYEEKVDCQKVIDTIKKEAAKAKVEDATK
jgi:uncharacterized protein YegP (UPF0339 family)